MFSNLKNENNYYSFTHLNLPTISLKNLCGEPMQKNVFQLWLRNMYFNTFGLNKLKKKSLADIIDFHQLLIHIGCNKIAEYNFPKLFEDKLNEFKLLMESFFIDLPL